VFEKSEGSGSKIFETGWVRSATCGPGKFYFPNFTFFLPSGQAKKNSRLKSYCGSEGCPGWVKAHL